MNVFYYIAESNPDACLNLCHSYGYVQDDVHSIDDLVLCMQDVVSSEGEPAMKDVLKLHPDKGVILETFGGQPLAVGYDGTLNSVPPYKKNCDGCSSMKNFNASGSDTNASSSSSTAGIFIVAAALLLSVAIITRK
jgi:hypothetical protein